MNERRAEKRGGRQARKTAPGQRREGREALRSRSGGAPPRPKKQEGVVSHPPAPDPARQKKDERDAGVADDELILLGGLLGFFDSEPGDETDPLG